MARVRHGGGVQGRVPRTPESTPVTGETRMALRHARDQAVRRSIDLEDALYGTKRCPGCDAHPDARTEGCKHCGERQRARERRARTDPVELRAMWKANRERARANKRTGSSPANTKTT